MTRPEQLEIAGASAPGKAAGTTALPPGQPAATVEDADMVSATAAPARLNKEGAADLRRVCLIDLSGVFRANWHATEHTDIGEAYRRTISAVNEYGAGYSHVAVCVDRPPYRRSEIDPHYKQQRERAPEVMIEQLRAVEQRLDDDGYHVFGAQGFEADDVIATLCEWAVKHGGEVTIYSADKDMLQLVGERVSVISTASRQKYGPAEVKEKMGVAPELVPDLLALTGDKADNVPGINGVGPKTAAAWLNEHGGLEGVLLGAARLEPARFREVVSQSKDIIARSWRLTQLSTDAPINPEKIMEPKEPKQTEAAEQEAEVIDMPKQTAIAKVEQRIVTEPVAWERALEPVGIEAAWKLAHGLLKSRMFGDWPNAEAILGVIMTGRSFGLDAVTSLRSFFNIKGRASPSSQLLIGLVKRSPICEWFRLVESTEKSATWETKRRDEPEATRMSYTLEDAGLAGLLKNDQWIKRPKTMLRWRAGVELARAVYPDLVSGLYSVEEMEDAA